MDFYAEYRNKLRTPEEPVKAVKSGDWVDVTATVKYEYVRQYRGKGPVLYADDVHITEKPEEEIIYF